MKTIAIAAIIGAAAAMSEIESEFLGFITKFGKSYKSMAEYEHRLRNFAVNHSFIQEHNVNEVSYKLGHNNMSDWTDAEYKAILTYKPEQFQYDNTFDKVEAASPSDWRTSQCLSPIQDQGQCGSCWAFSSVASIENNWCAHENQPLQKLSEQQLVDCVSLCFGCNGGNAALAFHYYTTHWAMTEASYPYTARTGSCNYNSGNVTNINDKGTTAVTANTPDAMKTALASNIMSVAIEADQRVFQLYSTGVFTNTNCGTQLDHATNVVGWGTSNGMDYWIMRNSWGTSWGMQGYMEIEIVSGNGLCGIQMQPNFPTMA
jgi:C1A family cysteine protease